MAKNAKGFACEKCDVDFYTKMKLTQHLRQVHNDFGNKKTTVCELCGEFSNICCPPVKNVTWIRMEIPCRFMSQIDGSLIQIDIEFLDYSMSCIQNIQVLLVFHAGT